MYIIIDPAIQIETEYKADEFISQKPSGAGFELAQKLRDEGKKCQLYTFLGGFNGYKIKDLCKKERIRLKYVRIAEENTTKIKINGQIFPIKIQKISKNDIKAFYHLLKAKKTKTQNYIFACSQKKNIPNNFFNDLEEFLKKVFPERKINVVIN
ncbi:hypothetical protein ACFL2K_03315 [Candidatus Margulisiibacteriota bacterium]